MNTMKKLFTLVFVAIGLLGSIKGNAQSFNVTADTVWYTISGSGVYNIDDRITAIVGSDTLHWNVVATDFPADWIRASGICDNFNCYNLNTLWPSGAVKQSDTYTNTGNRDFHLQLNRDTAQTPGTYYVRCKLVNRTAMDSVYATFMVKRIGVGVNDVNSSFGNVNVYPNPAADFVNIPLNLATAATVTISITDMAGRVVYNMPATTVNSGKQTLKMPASDLPAGVYNATIMVGSEKHTFRFTH